MCENQTYIKMTTIALLLLTMIVSQTSIKINAKIQSEILFLSTQATYGLAFNSQVSHKHKFSRCFQIPRLHNKYCLQKIFVNYF